MCVFTCVYLYLMHIYVCIYICVCIYLFMDMCVVACAVLLNCSVANVRMSNMSKYTLHSTEMHCT